MLKSTQIKLIQLRTSSVLITMIAAALTSFAQSFAPPVNYLVGSHPYAVAIGDFNGNGVPDLASANNSSNNVSVLLGNGDNTFGAKTDYPVGAGAYGILAADFNGDGKLDIATANSFSFTTNVSILLGNGNGTFQNKVDYPFAGLAQPNSILSGDFNGDAELDLVVANGSGASVFLGNGDGTLRVAVNYGSSNFATSVAIGDFNADSKLDLAVSSYGSGISVMLGNGDGTFLSPVNYDAGPSPFALTAVDLNGDSKLDLATVNIQVDRISVLLGNGNGTFGNAVSYPTGASPYGLAVGDFDSDGKPDIVIPGNGGGFSVVEGNGDGTLRPPIRFLDGGVFATVIDLNGDGKPDLISGALINSVCVLMNQTGPYRIDGTVKDANNVGVSGVNVFLTGGAEVAASTDTNGAYSFRDLATGGNYVVMPSRPNYSFVPPTQSFSNLSANATADFVAALQTFSISGRVRDGFGNPMSGVTVTLSGSSSNVVTTSSDGSYLFANLPAGVNYTVTPSLATFAFVPPSASTSNLSSNGVANFTGRKATYSISGMVTDIVTGSSIENISLVLTGTINGTATTNFSGYTFSGLPVDGNYTVSAYSSGVNSIFTNVLMEPPLSRTFVALSANMTASFSARRLNFDTGDLNPQGLARGDLNGDGKLDVAVATTTGSNIHILLGNGDGTLRPQVSYLADSNPINVIIADFNADGKLDVVSANYYGSDVSVFLGNGDGTLRSRVNYPVGSLASILKTGDFDGDGKLDLAVLSTENKLNILLGNGDGTFAPAITTTVATAVFSLSTGDFNGDHKLDLVVPGYPASALMLLGNGDGTFAAPVSYPAGTNIRKSFVADLNSDGKLDVALADFNAYTVLLGNGDGTLRSSVSYSLPSDTADVVSDDFDGDGKPDLAIANYFGGISFAAGNGDGTFKPAVFYSAGTYLGSLVSGDFNNDNRPDLAITVQGSSQVSVLLNSASTRLPALQLNALGYSVTEDSGAATITVTRTGDTSSAASVDYRTIDDPAEVRCDTINGTAYARCDYASTIDTLTFGPGESAKTISIPIVNDAFSEGNERFQIALSNPVGAVLGTTSGATVTITDNDQGNGSNPIFTTPFFVRQHYLDFLSREPEAGEPWSNVLNTCSDVNNNPACDRLTVSAAFFGSPEFKLKGYFVYRFYKLAFNRLPTYDEMVRDMRGVTGQTPAEVFQKKAVFTNAFVQRTEFASSYNIIDAQYVSALMGRYSLTQITSPDPADPDGTNKVTLTTADLTNQLNAGTLTRAKVLRAIADSDQVFSLEFNQAFVAMQYYGYLRRAPETAGYNAWLAYLTTHPTDSRTMVNGFMNSAEYRLRFGPQ